MIRKLIAVGAVAFSVLSQASELYMAGDSIMTDYRSQEWPQYGWGQSLKDFFKSPSSVTFVPSVE